MTYRDLGQEWLIIKPQSLVPSFSGSSDAAAAIATSPTGRPYRTGDVTQPLGLAWYTPEAWFSPISPVTAGQFAGSAPLAINVGLGSAAFTGWLSLQGPGPYRVGSSWYSFTANASLKGVSLTQKIICRISPKTLPQILIATEEGE